MVNRFPHIRIITKSVYKSCQNELTQHYSSLKQYLSANISSSVWDMTNKVDNTKLIRNIRSMQGANFGRNQFEVFLILMSSTPVDYFESVIRD